MKKNLRLLINGILYSLLLFTLASCGGREYTLRILHSNDHHGSTVARINDDGIGEGGLAARATFVKQERGSAENILVLDAGDINTGMAVSNICDAEVDIEAYNEMGYDAVALGNQEFTKGIETLTKQINESEFPWICANVKRGDDYLVNPYIIKEFGALKVGIFGLITRRTANMAALDKDIEFTDEITAAKDMVDTLRSEEDVDIVIALTHMGNVKEADDHVTSVDLARSVSGIDLIIDGHSETLFDEPLIVEGTPIVSAGNQCLYMGCADLVIKGGKIENLDWKAVKIDESAYPPDPEIAALVEPYVQRAEEDLEEVVMTTTETFTFQNEPTRYGETAIGDFMCDALVDFAASNGIAADFAFTNGGSIRARLPKGDVTKADIATMIPFDDSVYIVTLSGRDVKRFFREAAANNQGDGGFIQVSRGVNLVLTYDEYGANGSLTSVLVGGEPIDDNRSYTIVTNSYLAKGGDGYSSMRNSTDSFDTSLSMDQVFINYAQKQKGIVTPVTDGRLVIIGGVNS